MRTIIAGSRGIRDPNTVATALSQCGWWPSVVLSGDAQGPDRIGADLARALGIPVEVFKPDWRHGRDAGFRRNTHMANAADALIAVWDGVSNGTTHMIHIAQQRGLRVFVFKVDL